MILNVLKKNIFQNTYVELETPPPRFMEKSILNFHFDYWKISLNEFERSTQVKERLAE